MRDADEFPTSYKLQERPAWFKGEVRAYMSWQSVRYAGFLNDPQHTYHVYWWNGQHETFPEAYLQPRFAHHLYSTGRLTETSQESAPTWWSILFHAWFEYHEDAEGDQPCVGPTE